MAERPKGRLWLKILGVLFMVSGVNIMFVQDRHDGSISSGFISIAIGVLCYWRGTKPKKIKPLRKQPYSASDRLFIGRSIDIIQESLRIVANSSNWETKKSRMALVIDKLETLVSTYNNHKDTETFRSELERYKEQQAELHLLAAKEPVKICIIKARNSKAVSTQLNQFSKALTIIDEATFDPLVDRVELTKLREAVVLARSQVEMIGHTSQGAKQEFKGNKAKALDSYQEALWHLLNDDVDDSLQAEEIERLKAKIAALQSELNTKRVKR